MSFEIARVKIQTIFKDGFETPHIGTVSCFYEGTPLNPPDDQPYTLLMVLDGDGSSIEVGSNSPFRRSGIVQVNVYGTPAKTTKEVNELAQSIADLYQNKDFQTTENGRIFFRVGRLKNAGVRNGRQIGILTIPYFRDSTR
jgi:hypothetical protein